MKIAKRLALVGVAVAVVLGLAASPANAWTRSLKSCSIQEFWLEASCNSGAVEANPVDHAVWFSAAGSSCPLQIRIRDVGNGNVVYSGVTPTGNYVGGLYGWYRIEASRTGGVDCGGWAKIRNYFS
jgi:hypothetical protein